MKTLGELSLWQMTQMLARTVTGGGGWGARSKGKGKGRRPKECMLLAGLPRVLPCYPKSVGLSLDQPSEGLSS